MANLFVKINKSYTRVHPPFYLHPSLLLKNVEQGHPPLLFESLEQVTLKGIYDILKHNMIDQTVRSKRLRSRGKMYSIPQRRYSDLYHHLWRGESLLKENRSLQSCQKCSSYGFVKISTYHVTYRRNQHHVYAGLKLRFRVY